MNEIQKYIIAHEPEMMNDLFSLIRIPSISALPEHHDDMLACAERWAQLLLEAGAYGKRDFDEMARILFRSVSVGLFIALCLLLLQYPIRLFAFTLLDSTAEVEQLATVYFNICIWGVPAVLGLYGFA